MRTKTNLSPNLAFGHTFYRQVANLEYVPTIDPERKSDVKSNVDAILDSIFAVDPVTMLPSGDIAQFMSTKVSPEIREFIRQNLMSPVPDDGVSAKFGSLSDDDIVAFSRQSGESLDDYRSRLVGFLRDSMSKPDANK